MTGHQHRCTNHTLFAGKSQVRYGSVCYGQTVVQHTSRGERVSLLVSYEDVAEHRCHKNKEVNVI